MYRAIKTPGKTISPKPRKDYYSPSPFKTSFIGRLMEFATSTIIVVLKTQNISYKKVPQSRKYATINFVIVKEDIPITQNKIANKLFRNQCLEIT